MVEGTPPGDARQPPKQQATPARKGARCGAGAGSPRPQRPHPGYTGRGTLAARSRGRAPGGGTAPDTRRASQRWRATPPGDGPPPAPRHGALTGHAGQGDSVGPPHPHTRAHSTWVADPNSPPSGRAVGGGTAPDLRRPSQWWKAPPPGTPFRHPHSEQHRPARAHAVGPVLGPHARTDRTRDTRVAEPWLPAPEDGRPGEGQRLTPDAPHNGGRPSPPRDGPPPPPRHAAPTGHAGQGDSVGPRHPHTRTHSTWVADPNSPPSGRAIVGGTAPDLRRHSQWWKAPPPGTPFRHPHSEQRRPARAHPVGPVLGPQARTDRTRDTRVAEPWLPAPEDGQTGEGQRLTPDAPHNGGRPPPPGDGSPSPPRHAALTGHAGQGDSVGPQHPHTRAHSTWVAEPNSPPSGRAVGGGTAPDLRRPSQWWKAPPPGTPFSHPNSKQRQPARAHAVGPVLGPHARTDGTRDTRVAEPWLPAPEDGRPGEGQRLTPDAPHNGGRPPPPGDGPPSPPRHAALTGHAGQGDSVGPQHPHTRAQSTWVAEPNSPPSGRAVGGGTAPDLRRPSQWWKAPPPGTPFRHPHSEQRRPARAHPVGPVLGPQARTDRTRDTRVAEPWLPAPEDGQTGEGQRLTPDAPHNGGRPPPPGDGPPSPPRHAALTGHAGQGDSVGPPHPHTRAQSTWVAEPNSPPSGRAVGGGTAPDLRRPSQWWKAPPPGTPFSHPNSKQRRPARAHAVGPVLGPHARTDRTRDTRVAEPWLPAPEDGLPGEGQRLTPDAPHNGGGPPPPQRPPTNPAARSPHRACRPRGQCWAPTPTHLRPQHVGGGPQQPAQWPGSRGRDSD